MIVKLHPKADKFLENRNEPDYSRLKNGLGKLKAEPPTGDIIPLSGHKGEFRVRIGGFRVLFHYDMMADGTEFISVDSIDNRGQAYKG